VVAAPLLVLSHAFERAIKGQGRRRRNCVPARGACAATDQFEPVSLKTAKAPAIAISRDFLLLADEVIE
jgi:hypothetical protein